MFIRAKRDEAGASQSGSGGSTPTGTQQQPTTPQTPPPTGGQPTPTPGEQPQPTGQPEQTIPYARFKEVNDRLQALESQKREQDETTAKEQGKWQELAEKKDADLKVANERFVSVARRAAFVSAASAAGVVDPMAAYKLANADGLLKDVKVDDDGNADADAIAKALKASQDAYKFLKRDGSFGGERSGQPEPPTDPANMTAKQRMAQAYGTPKSR